MAEGSSGAAGSHGKVAFELVSPERMLASVAADMVVVPGEEGDFGVLVDHAPLLSLLRPGLIEIYQGNSVAERIFVEGGFAEVNPNGLIVLAEAANPLAELTVDEARSLLRNAEDDLADAKTATDAERERLERAIAIARLRVEAVETHGGA
jgi:F-type H+-transporting ATPase subunit epsilon